MSEPKNVRDIVPKPTYPRGYPKREPISLRTMLGPHVMWMPLPPCDGHGYDQWCDACGPEAQERRRLAGPATVGDVEDLEKRVRDLERITRAL